jgi:DNA-binding PadR family transcriptional regulator
MRREDIENEIRGMNIYTALDAMKKKGFNVTKSESEDASEVYYENADGTEYAYWYR